MSKTRHFMPTDPVKALKRSARDNFGFEQTRISKNHKKFDRNRENRIWKKESNTYLRATA